MAESGSYRTLAHGGSAQLRLHGSEFLSQAAPVGSVDDAEAFKSSVETDHPDATHHVFAYRVRADPFREYAADDGEPSGSAGRPALGVLQGKELENVAVVITRYFGGTELGVGGLVRAYTQATKDAVAAGRVIEEQPHERVVVTASYPDSGTVRNILESEAVAFEATYEESVTFTVHVPVADAASLRDRLRSATSDRVDLSDSV